MSGLNLRLATWLAWRSLARQPMVAAATVLGVAIGMSVVGSILIVDHHSATSAKQIDRLDRSARNKGVRTPTFQVRFERKGETAPSEALPSPSLLPTQKGAAARLENSVRDAAGEEDYQAMRLAVRLGSLLAFGVGAVIVLYTLRFSVVVRTRETSLLRCLGESRRNVVLSLLIQAAGFGIVGTTIGLGLSVPFAIALLRNGITTTGRSPSVGAGLPVEELLAMAGISVAISLLGVVDPVRRVLRQDIAESLNPRFLSSEVDERSFRHHGFRWIVPPLLGAAYLAFRPFLRGWVSVVEFFVVEVAVLVVLAFATLWLVPAILRASLGPFERTLVPWLPLEGLLVGRRMRLTSQSLVFTIGCVALAFSLLTALHDVTESLKHEIRIWSQDALDLAAFYRPGLTGHPDARVVQSILDREALEMIHLSDRMRGGFPVRLVRADDVNPRRRDAGRPLLGPGKIVLSRTLAARSGVEMGDAVLISDGETPHRLEIIEVADDLGYFARRASYVSQKLYAVASEGNPIFEHSLEPSLGEFLVVRRRDPEAGGPSDEQQRTLGVFYRFIGSGSEHRAGRVQEIDRDFLIFDFILAMTVFLAAIGVANNMLIQVHGRRRELSVLRTVGVDRRQTVRLILVEGLVIGCVGALLALVLGHVIGAISVSFLNQFTLFDYRFVFSPQSSLAIAGLAVGTCAVAAVYPALVAPRISSAESLHYE